MLRKMIHVPRLPDENATQIPTWRWNVLRQLLLVVWTHCTDRDERSEKGNKLVIVEQNMMRLPSLKKELGSQCHGRRFRVWR